MIPDERHPGFGFSTWRQALITAARGIQEAKDRRRRMMIAARDAGLSYREIGEIVGMTAAGVHKITGNIERAKPDDLAGMRRVTDEKVEP